jgi:glycosyltransferase involved in cell wall biosynthesis
MINTAKSGFLSIYCTPNFHDNVSGFDFINENLILSNICCSSYQDIKNSVIIFPSTSNYPSIEEIELLKNNGNIIIYDYIDEISPEITGSIEIQMKRHREISPKNVDYVCAVSLKLYNEMLKRFPEDRVIYLPNGVEFNHFNVEKDIKNIPEVMKGLIDRPIIGYFGALASWIDYDLINYVAENRPEWNIVIIGVDYDGSMKNLKDLSNIIYLGFINYKELPKYAVWFDVAIIPFREGEIAKTTSPIKMYEYMALGKPVVFTKDLEECKLYKTPIMAESREDSVEKLELALSLSKDEEFVRKVKEEAKENDWSKRVEKLLKTLNLS